MAVTPKESSAYIPELKDIKLRKSLAYALKEEFSSVLTTDQYRFMLAVVAGTDGEHSTIPLPRNAVEKCLKNGKQRMTAEERDILIDSGLLQRDYYDQKAGKCYHYWLGPYLKTFLYENMDISLEHACVQGMVNLSNFRQARPRRSVFGADDTQNIRGAIAMIQRNKLNITSLDRARAVLRCANPLKYIASERCLDAVIRQGLSIHQGIGIYVPAYTTSKTGRMFEMGGGMQSVCRAYKAAAYAMENVQNYDLKSSQLTALLQIAGNELAPQHRQCLHDYTTSDKACYAKEMHVDTDTWKMCLLALFFGAKLAPSLLCSIYKELFTYHGQDWAKAQKSFARFKDVAQPFIDLRDDWFHVLTRLVHRASYQKRGIRYLNNALGKTMQVQPGWSAGKVSAFLLQGLEAAFTYAIIELAPQFDYEVLANEHDGVVVEGEIPEEAQDLAKFVSGFQAAQLVPKSFIHA